MSTVGVSLEQVWSWLGEVADPEIPVISVVDLGIVRDVAFDGDTCVVTITPTYSGCPAMQEIEADVRAALPGYDVEVRTVLAPAWTTDWMTDEVLAGIAGKAVKEVAYHLDHARSWVVRLGDGTPESHRRVQAGLDEVWPYAYELFERDALVDTLVRRGVAADPDLLRPQWEATVTAALAEATLTVPETTWRPTGGRSGRHLTSFGPLLAQLQHLHRSHPGARW